MPRTTILKNCIGIHKISVFYWHYIGWSADNTLTFLVKWTNVRKDSHLFDNNKKRQWKMSNIFWLISNPSSPSAIVSVKRIKWYNIQSLCTKFISVMYNNIIKHWWVSCYIMKMCIYQKFYWASFMFYNLEYIILFWCSICTHTNLERSNR